MVFYLVCFSIGAFIFYKNSVGILNKQMDGALAQRHDSLERKFAADGIEGVIKGISAIESENPLVFGVGYQVSDASGSVIAGKVTEPVPAEGIYDARASELGFGDSDTGFRVYTDGPEDYSFTVALNASFRDDLLKGYLSSIALTFFATAVVALLGAMFLSHKHNHRYSQLANFMEGVGNGDLNQRLPISSRDDDVDRLSRDINNAVALLKRQIAGMSQVSSNIAHDLKTPLNRLSIKIEEALFNTTEDQPVHEMLITASDNATEINDTFEKLLYIAQLDAGARKSRFVFTDLRPTLSKVVEVFSAVAADKGQTLKLTASDNLRLLGDDDLLLQLVVNLTENSISHNGSGIEIEIAAGVEQGQPWVTVSDNGNGIPKAERELLFDPLYRVEKSRTTKGSGLGLSLVRAIVELHGATIELSDNSPGLRTMIRFPA